MFYLETRIGPHGPRSVVGGQAAEDGRPLVEYQTREAAQAAIPEIRAAMAETAKDSRGRGLIREINVCLTDDLRVPGYGHYMRMSS